MDAVGIGVESLEEAIFFRRAWPDKGSQGRRKMGRACHRTRPPPRRDRHRRLELPRFLTPPDLSSEGTRASLHPGGGVRRSSKAYFSSGISAVRLRLRAISKGVAPSLFRWCGENPAFRKS